MIVDDCESAVKSGSELKGRARVWPQDGNNCILALPFNGVDPGSDGKELRRILNLVRAVHKQFFKNVAILDKDIQHHDWLEKALEKKANGKKTCPIVADALSRVMKCEE